MRIGIDIDGVLADYNNAYMKLLNHSSGRQERFASGHPTKWWWPTEEFGFTREDLEYSMAYTSNRPEFWRQEVKAYSGVDRFLPTLADAQTFEYADIYFVTARSGLGCKRATELWLTDHGYDEIPTVIMSNNSKGLIAAGINLDVVLEDSPAQCDDILRYCGTDIELYMLDRPYNHAYKRREVKRVYTLDEFLKAQGFER